MKNNYFQKGETTWDNESILSELDKFIPIYESRPIKNNKGGMQFASMFYFFFILKNKKPSFVIESGVFKGQSTWLIEKTLPNSEVLSIDIDLNQREYFSKKSKYSNIDFKFQDFTNFPSDTLVLFDDHVNHLTRLIESKFFNIKNIVFEDNYSVNEGDFQTLKQIYNNFTFNHKPGFLSLIKSSLMFNKIIFNKMINKNYFANKDIDLMTKRIRDGYNDINFKSIEKNISTYFEFPPFVYDKKITNYEKKPLLDKLPEKLNLKFSHFLNSNFLTYVELI